MKSESEQVRNPFGVMDVPNPNDQEVVEFAASAPLEATSDDENAKAWSTVSYRYQGDAIEGNWSMRWNGGVDATIPGDIKDKWKHGQGEVRMIGERVYFLFDWDYGRRKGLIDAWRDGTSRLIGKYLNLSNPTIMRPWIGLTVSNQRIDGRWTGGRLDFRR